MNTPQSTPPSATASRLTQLRDRVAVVKEQATDVVETHKALAQAEVKQNITQPVSKGVAMFAVAAVLGLNGLTLLFVTAALGIYQLGLDPWAGFGIVTLLLFIVTGILALVGKKALSKIGPPKETISAAKTFVAELKSTLQG